jgi:class 3 adenylate cyclase
MGQSEQAGLRVRKRHRRLLRRLAERHHGKIVDENGDELVGVFPSALDAVSCALAAQAALRDDTELKLRIRIHSGDVIFEGGRVYGDGVNVASRIRPLAEPGGVAISEPVFDAGKN